MESFCRLCCSTNFVNNDLFDEENALNLKMELFMPIKVMKGDQLPQKVCNRCSCKVNDIYQFCNIALEAQDRLRGMLLNISTNINDSIDLTMTKRETLLPILPVTSTIEQGTQTDETINKEELELESPKVEPKSHSPSPIKKEECMFEPEHCDDSLSVDSDDISLFALKRKKTSQKPNTNGEAPMKRGRKKKGKLKELIMNALSDTNNVRLLEKPDKSMNTDVKKEFIETDDEEDSQDIKLTVKVKKTVVVKKEPSDADMYQCCTCLKQCYSRSAILHHYRQHAVSERVVPPVTPALPTGDAPRCTRCRKVVEGGAEAWAAHWTRHWEKDTRPYRCILCEKTFREPHLILKHGMTHKPGEDAPEKPVNKRFICDFCPEGFVYMSAGICWRIVRERIRNWRAGR